MNKSTKLRLGTYSAAVLLIAFHALFAFLYGGEYIDANKYIISVAATAIFTAIGIPIFRILYTKSRYLAILCAVCLSLIGITAVTYITGTYIYDAAGMLTVSIWPLFCFGLASLFGTYAETHGKSFIVGCIAYNIIIIPCVLFICEALIKAPYLSADTVSEVFMLVTAQVAFLFCAQRNEKTRKRDIICSAVMIVASLAVLCLASDRIDNIINSIREYGPEQTDQDGEFLNWLYDRAVKIKTSLSGDFSTVNKHVIHTMAKRCPTPWLSRGGNFFVGIVTHLASAAMSVMMRIYAFGTKNALAKTIAVTFAFKTVIGIFTGLLLIYSTFTGTPFILSAYDIVLLAIFLFCTKEQSLSSDAKNSIR